MIKAYHVVPRFHCVSRTGSASAITGPIQRYGSCRRLPTEAVRVRHQVRSRAIYDEQSGNGAGFLRVLRFPLKALIPPNLLSSGAGTKGLLVAGVPSGLSLIHHHQLKNPAVPFIYRSFKFV
jgi:hypothetical protein